MKQRKALLFLVALFFIGVMYQPALATESEILFQLPVDDYVVDGYYFGEPLGGGIYHLGEDCAKDPLTPVYAIADGEIIAQEIGLHTNFGYVSVIEHDLGNDTYVCSVIGHLRQVGYQGDHATLLIFPINLPIVRL